MRRLWVVCLLFLLASVSFSVFSTAARAAQSASTPDANTIMINTSPAALRIEVNGTPVTAPFSFSCDPGTNRTINAPSPQVNGSTRYVFLNWSDGGSQFHTIDCSASGNYTAYFGQEYELSMDTSPSGLTIGVDGVGYTAPAVVWCRTGSVHGVNAPSPQGFNASLFTFVNWSDGGGAVHTVPCDSPRSLVAFFAIRILITVFSNLQQPFSVQVNGMLRVLPADIVCDFGTNLTLFVTTPQTVSGSTWRFTGWSDFAPNPRTIRCDGPGGDYTANFERIDVTGPNPPPPIIAFVIVVIIVAFVAILGVVLWMTSRKQSPMASAPPVPLTVRPPVSLATRCPNCGSFAASDWTYCMVCGASLH